MEGFNLESNLHEFMADLSRAGGIYLMSLLVSEEFHWVMRLKHGYSEQEANETIDLNLCVRRHL